MQYYLDYLYQKTHKLIYVYLFKMVMYVRNKSSTMIIMKIIKRTSGNFICNIAYWWCALPHQLA